MGKRQAFDPERTRTVALVGHRSAGKTSLGELILHAAGVTRAVGRVDDGTGLLDFHEDERRRGLSLELSYAWLEWSGHQINLVDTPGSEAAVHQRAFGLAAADGAIVVVDATAGVQVGTEDAVSEATALRLPMIVAVNKVDRPHDLEATVAALGSLLGKRPIPLVLPFLEDGEVRGVISVLDETVLRYSTDHDGTWSPEPVPDAYREELRSARERVAEAVALTDDDLLEHYLEFLELPPDRLDAGLVNAVRTCRFVPVVAVSALWAMGAAPLLDRIVGLLPSPLDRVAPLAKDSDGAPVSLGPDGPFVAQLVSTHEDADGEVYHVLRVWSGTPPRGAWFLPRTAARVRVHKLYEIRGPRRATAHTLRAGAFLATWDPLPASPGDTVTEGAHVVLAPPPPPPPMMSLLVRPTAFTGRPGPTRGRSGRREEGRARLDERLAKERLSRAAERVVRRDPALQLDEDPVTGHLLVSGTGDAHLELTLERIRAIVGDGLRAELPPVPYRETPRGAVLSVEGVHLRETLDGLVHEFGRCVIDVIPTGRNAGTPLGFVDRLPPEDFDDLPARFRPAVEDGLRAASGHGPTAGYPVVDLEIRLTGGAYDILQSADDHFRRAGEKALRTALQRAGTVLLEPWCALTVTAPQPSVGDLIADLAGHRGRIVGLDSSGHVVEITAHLPYREVRTLPARLKALTQGRGRFSRRHLTYEVLPAHLESDAVTASPFLDHIPQMREIAEPEQAAVGGER